MNIKKNRTRARYGINCFDATTADVIDIEDAPGLGLGDNDEVGAVWAHFRHAC